MAHFSLVGAALGRVTPLQTRDAVDGRVSRHALTRIARILLGFPPMRSMKIHQNKMKKVMITQEKILKSEFKGEASPSIYADWVNGG